MQWPDLIQALALNPLLPAPGNLPPELVSSGKLVWSTAATFRAASESGPLAYLVTSPFELGTPAEVFLPPFAIRPEVPLIVSLYDLIPLLRAEAYLADPNLAQAYRTRLEVVQGADLVLAISESSRQDAIRLLNLDPRLVFNIGAGVSEFFHPPGPSDSPSDVVRASLPSIRRPYVFSVLGAEERKNAERLISAYAALPSALRNGHQLVIACEIDDVYRRRWRTHADSHGLRDDEVVLTDLIDDFLLRSLYQTARLFVFPSLYEGFGLPAAEAAACGCPVITSNNSSLPEVLNFEQATFDALDVDDMSQTIRRALLDDGFDRDLRAASRTASASHSWISVGGRTVAALESLSPRRARRSRGGDPKPRIALVGPFPPTRSGIADYNFKIARELAKKCHLDLFYSQGTPPGDDDWPLPARRFSLQALGRTLSPFAYDAIIYSFGNSDHHHSTYETALRWPGIVWLHDTQLSGLYLSYAGSRMSPGDARQFLVDKLHSMYGNRVPPPLLEKPFRPIDDYVEFGVGLSAELVSAASGVIVNSELALRSVQLDHSPFLRKPPMKVVPLAADPPSPHTSTSPKVPLIGSFGIGARHKAPDLLIRSLALVKEQMPVKLVFVGPTDYDPALRPMLEECAADHGVANAVQFAGNVSDVEYQDYLKSVACAAQLRSNSHGESSASINDCLSRGVPVITNVAACREMPPGTVDFIDEELTETVVAGRIRALLTDEALRKALTISGQEYARARSFGRAAGEILAFVAVVGAGGQKGGVEGLAAEVV